MDHTPTPPPNDSSTSSSPLRRFRPKGAGIFDNSSTMVGRGTTGLGDKCRNANDDRIRLEYKKWAASKNETRGGGGNDTEATPKYMSPREVSERDRQAVQEAKYQHEAQLKESAAAIQKERQQIRDLLAKRKAEEQRAVHHVISHKREADTARRKQSIAIFYDEKERQLEQQKQQDRENRDEWKQMLEDEREAERNRIAASKERFRIMHERSKKQIVADREAKMEKIQKQKQAEREKLESWRSEQNRQAEELHKESAKFRQHLQDGISRSKMENEEHKKLDADEIKKDFQGVKTMADKRVQQRELDRLEKARAAKQATQNTYAIKLDEIRAEKKATADEIRFKKSLNAREREHEQQERILMAREMKELGMVSTARSSGSNNRNNGGSKSDGPQTARSYH